MKPEIKIEYIPIDALKPYERNTRKHEERDITAIKASIEQFGFNDPIGIWHDTIVEGHGRLLAAKELGMTEVPVIRLDHLDDEGRRAYAIAHNKTAENSEWDMPVLAEELRNLEKYFDMTDFGFDTPTDFGFETPTDEALPAEGVKGSLKDKYLVPPFSVIYGNKADWLARKRAWVAKGLRSEVGRGGATCVSVSRLDGQTSTR